MKNVNKTKESIISMYLDYVNNFISVYGFSDYYNIECITAYRIIDIGRKLVNG
jgi:hypothetical protein